MKHELRMSEFRALSVLAYSKNGSDVEFKECSCFNGAKEFGRDSIWFMWKNSFDSKKNQNKIISPVNLQEET